MGPDELLFGKAVVRISRLIMILTAAGVCLGWILFGWRWAAGFLLGAAASHWNFRWFRQIVSALGNPDVRPRKLRRSAVFLGLRYLLLVLGAYVILNYSTLSLKAALTGLFVPVAAVTLEIVFELYAGT